MYKSAVCKSNLQRISTWSADPLAQVSEKHVEYCRPVGTREVSPQCSVQYPSAGYIRRRLVPKRSALTVVLGLTLASIEQRAASPQESSALRVVHPRSAASSEHASLVRPEWKSLTEQALAVALCPVHTISASRQGVGSSLMHLVITRHQILCNAYAGHSIRLEQQV